MSFQTKLDLSQQSRIPTGQTADWQGSVNIGETLRIGGFEIDPRSPFLGSTLLFDGFTQSYKSGKVIGNTGIATGYDGENLIISFTGSSTTVGPRLQSINNLTTDGIMVNYGTDVTTVSLSGSSDFTLFNPSGILGANIELSLSNTGVSGGTYGSSTIIPSITVDNKGRVLGISGNSINVVTYLSGLTDVYMFQPIPNNSILMYDNNVDLWFNGSVAQSLGYTPVTEARTLTINGESYDLTADRSWTVDTMTKICPNIVTLSGTPYYTASYGDSVYVDTDLVADNCFVTLPSSNIYGGLVYIKNLANPSTYSVSVNSFILQNGEWLLLRKGKFDAWEIVSSSLTDTPSNGNYEHGITSYGVWNALNGYIPITGTTPSGKITGDLLTNTANDVKFGIFESVPQLYLNVSSTTGIGLYYGISGAIRSKVELSNTQVNISGQTRVEMYAGNNYFHLQQSTGTSTLNTAGSFVLDAPVITLTNANSGSYTNISTKGLLIPNISTADRVSSNGSIAYNTLNTQFEGYRGGSWKNFLMEGDLIAYSGTTNRITITTGYTIDIASNYSGQTTINTVGSIITGSWSGTPIMDAYIASASTWNGKFNTPTGLTTNTVSRWNGTSYENSYITELTGTVGDTSGVGATRPYPTFNQSGAPSGTNSAWSGYLKYIDNGVNFGRLYIYSHYTNGQGPGWYEILTNQNTLFSVLATSSPAIGMGLSSISNSTSTLPTNLYTGEIRNLSINGYRFGLSVFQAGGGAGFLKFEDGMMWQQSITSNFFMRDWDGAVIGATANGGKGGGNTTLRYNTNIHSCQVRFKAMTAASSQFFVVEGYFTVNSSGAVVALDITKDSQNTSIFNVSITDTRLAFGGSGGGTVEFICVKETTGGFGASYIIPQKNERYSPDGTVKYWAGAGGLALGTNTINALTQLDLQSTSKGLGLNLIAGDLGTTRNGLVWYDTIANSFKGVQNGGVVNLLTGSGLSTNRLTKWSGSGLVNTNIEENTTDINTSLPVNDSLATVSSTSVLNLPQVYNIVNGTTTITELRGAGGITVQNGAVRVLRFSGSLTITSGGGVAPNRIDNGSFGSIVTQAGDTAVYRKEGADWVLQSYKRSNGSPLTLGSYLDLASSSVTVSNTNPVQPVQIGRFVTADTNRGFLMFANGDGNQLLRPYDGQFWVNRGDGGFLALWDGRRIASPANGGNSSISTSIAKYATSNADQKIKVDIYNVVNSPYYHISAIITVTTDGSVSNINILQPSIDTAAFDLVLNSGRAQITGTAQSLLFTATYQRLTFDSWGRVRNLGIENERYSADATVKYWAGSGGFALGTATINARAQLELQSTSKGFLPNRLTTTERDAISWVSGDAGMIIYNTTTNKHQGWNGSTWNDLY
jgi:hypothetical protein